MRTQFGYKQGISWYFVVFCHTLSFTVYEIETSACNRAQHRIIQHNTTHDLSLFLPTNGLTSHIHMRPDTCLCECILLLLLLVPSQPRYMPSSDSESEMTVCDVEFCKHKNKKHLYWPTVNCQAFVVHGTHFSLSVTFAETS